jgi:hypothetical protein
MDDDDSWRGQEEERQAAVERYNDDILQNDKEERERSSERDDFESYRRERDAENDRNREDDDTWCYERRRQYGRNEHNGGVSSSYSGVGSVVWWITEILDLIFGLFR